MLSIASSLWWDLVCSSLSQYPEFLCISSELPILSLKRSFVMFALSWEDSTSSSIISLQLSSDLLEELIVSLLSRVDSFCELEESVSVGEKCWVVVSWLSSLLLGSIVDGDRVSVVRFSCPCSVLWSFSCCWGWFSCCCCGFLSFFYLSFCQSIQDPSFGNSSLLSKS